MVIESNKRDSLVPVRSRRVVAFAKGRAGFIGNCET